MTIPKFTGDEDKDEIDQVKWLRMINEHDKDPLQESLKFDGENYKWWISLEEDIRLYSTWE
jgi:hypothetical protein